MKVNTKPGGGDVKRAAAATATHPQNGQRAVGSGPGDPQVEVALNGAFLGRNVIEFGNRVSCEDAIQETALQDGLKKQNKAILCKQLAFTCIRSISKDSSSGAPRQHIVLSIVFRRCSRDCASRIHAIASCDKPVALPQSGQAPPAPPPLTRTSNLRLHLPLQPLQKARVSLRAIPLVLRAPSWVWPVLHISCTFPFTGLAISIQACCCIWQASAPLTRHPTGRSKLPPQL